MDTIDFLFLQFRSAKRVKNCFKWIAQNKKKPLTARRIFNENKNYEDEYFARCLL